MSLNVNGITIPTNATVKVGNTEITKIQARNGTSGSWVTVWEKDSSKSWRTIWSGVKELEVPGGSADSYIDCPVSTTLVNKVSLVRISGECSFTYLGATEEVESFSERLLPYQWDDSLGWGFYLSASWSRQVGIIRIDVNGPRQVMWGSNMFMSLVLTKVEVYA